MYLPKQYLRYPLWLTIDVEVLTDANFGITPKKSLAIDYERLVENWIELCASHNVTSTAFVLGSFAKKYPQAVRNLQRHGHEIACHGLVHDLVYQTPFEIWKSQISDAKKILEDTTGAQVSGYRSPSWSLPFEKRYYEALIETGFAYSSSYFPFKTYMYGNSIDKKHPFVVTTKAGKITEIPVPKYLIPFSGGFYLRILPLPIIEFLLKRLIQTEIKPILYTHPYELLPNLFTRFFDSVRFDKAYILTFAQTGSVPERIDKILEKFSDTKDGI